MAVQNNNSGAVPTSSGRNRFATQRTLWIAGVVLVLLVILLLPPW